MRKLLIIPRCIVAGIFFILAISSFSQSPTISYQLITNGLTAPVDIVNAHNGSNHLYIVQQGGTIKMWNGSTLSDFIDLTSIISTGGERGLLSMAFDPAFNGTTNRYFYIYYTNTSGDVEVSRLQTIATSADTGDIATRQVVITIPHPTNSNHNGGKLNFGPDGYLYFGTGDGGSANDPPNNAQNGNVLLGKMLRINVDAAGPAGHPLYLIPADNPYVGVGGFQGEIWNLGLRNPFRWSFDKTTGDMWIADVGQGNQEEVDYLPSGNTGHHNFGWRCYEGYVHTPGVAACTPDPPTDYYPPIYHYPHPVSSPPSIAIIGGNVYRGTDYPTFNGYYIASEFYSGDVILLWPNGAGGFDSSLQTAVQTGISAYGEDENNRLYAISETSNALFKVVATGGTPLPVTLQQFSVQHFANFNEIKWTTSYEEKTSVFHIEYSTDKTNFMRAGDVIASRKLNGSSYEFHHNYITSEATYYRLAIQDDNGLVKYSTLLKVAADEDNKIRIFPTIVHNNIINLVLTMPAEKLQVINTNGGIVFERDMKYISGTAAISLPALPKGIYVVRIITKNEEKKQKIIIE